HVEERADGHRRKKDEKCPTVLAKIRLGQVPDPVQKPGSPKPEEDQRSRPRTRKSFEGRDDRRVVEKEQRAECDEQQAGKKRGGGQRHDEGVEALRFRQPVRRTERKNSRGRGTDDDTSGIRIG